MTPEQLRREWETAGDALLQFPDSAFEGVNLPTAAMRFLAEVGLPRDAAPFLTFGLPFDAPPDAPPSGRLPTVAELYGPGPELEKYYAIGFNGSGDPIVVLPDGSVAYLNHDFEFLPVYMNRDLPTLAEALLRLRQLVVETQRLRGPEAYLDRLVPKQLRAEFISYLNAADPRALDGPTMWTEEVESWAEDD